MQQFRIVIVPAWCDEVNVANTFGVHFKVHSFGESHGAALGAIVDGCPAGVRFDHELLQRELDRRKPGTSSSVSARAEADQCEILSGVFEGKTLGTPIAMMVRNLDARSQDYEKIAKQPRAGHADDVWKEKFGHSDPRGGGRSSGRETIARVMGGAVARMVMRELAPEMAVESFAREIGPYKLTKADQKKEEVASALVKLREQGNSWGGIAEIHVNGVPKGLGQPVFRKLKSDLTAALMSVGAVSAVEFGDGLHSPSRDGISMHKNSGEEVYGGVRGGISTGEPIVLRAHVKPTSSILDVAKQGRHDPCVLIRALPVLESMAALVVVDHLLWQRLDKI